MRTFAILLIGLVCLISLSYIDDVHAQVTQSVTPSFTNIDISSSANANDHPFAITGCSDNTFRYIGLYSQGAIAKVNKSTGAVQIIDDDSPTVASGEDWYSFAETSAKVFGTEKDTGKIVVFNKGTSSFENSFSITDNISGGVISYPDGFNNAPHKIAVAGSGTHVFGFNSFGELKYDGTNLWMVTDYVRDFTAGEEAAGAVDSAFHGVVKIDPNTNAVTRYAISGATALRGLDLDSSNSTVLWVTDITQEKLYKFNKDTGLVEFSLTLPTGSKPRGIANTNSTIYIAENQSGPTTSKILKVAKSNLAITEIDTGANVANLKTGTFSVDISNNFLIWTDDASHIGTISLLDESVRTVSDTSASTTGNHFGCTEGNNYYFAGQGSVHQGVINTSGGGTSESSHGDSCAGDCYSPSFGEDENGKEFYNDGLTITAKNFTKIINIQNVLHVLSNETINIPVGFPINFTLKAMDSYPDQIKSCEIAFGIQRGHFVKQDAEFILGVKRSFDGIVSTYEEGNKNAYRDFDATIENQDKYVFCKFVFTPTHHLKHDMFAIQAIDIHQYDGMYFVNEGVFFRGISEIGTPIFDYMDKQGKLHTLTILDQTLENTSIAIDENGELWHIESNFWLKDFVRPDMTGSLSKYHGYDRDDYWEFKAYKFGQELLATQLWDSSKIQKTVGPSFTYKITNYERGHDPVPNMMKAIGEYEKSKLLN